MECKNCGVKIENDNNEFCSYECKIKFSYNMQNYEKKIRIAGIIRKSPTKKVEESKEIQMKSISDRIKIDFPNKNIQIDWFFDICKGDDPNRVELKNLFKRLDDNKKWQYKYAYVYNVDRFSRSWLGIKWFHEYFTENVYLRFCNEVGNLYETTGAINPDQYMVFFIMCGFAQAELMRIRRRIKAGIERIKKNPKLRSEKYKGGKMGRKRSV